METTARNRTIGGIVIGAILLVLLLILFSCTLASDPAKQSKKAGDPIGAPSATPTLSPYASPTEKPHKKKQGDDTVDTSAVGAVPAVDTGVTYVPAAQIPSGVSLPEPKQPPSAGLSWCDTHPKAPACAPPPPPAPAPPTSAPTEPAPTSPPATTTPTIPPICLPIICNPPGQTDHRAPDTPEPQCDAQGDGTATIMWPTPDANDGKIAYYTVTRTPPGAAARQGDNSVTYVDLQPGTQYDIEVSATDDSGNESQAGRVSWPYQCDDEPPTAPTDVTVTHTTGTAADISWTASSDDTYVDHYEIAAYQDGRQVGQPVTVDGDQTSGSVTGLDKSTTYTFVVTAVDAVNNQTPSAASAPATTTDKDDTTPPSVPTGLTASDVTSDSFALSWAASTDDQSVQDALVYHVHVTKTQDILGLPLPPMTVVDEDLPAGQTSYTVDTSQAGGGTYTATVTATDQAGNESQPSSELDVNVPDSAAAASKTNANAPKSLLGSQSPSPTEAPSELPSVDPSEVPSVPSILAPLTGGSSSPSSEPASPRSSEPTPTPTPSPTPTDSPSASPSATPESSSSSSGGIVSGVLGAVTGGQ